MINATRQTRLDGVSKNGKVEMWLSLKDEIQQDSMSSSTGMITQLHI